MIEIIQSLKITLAEISTLSQELIEHIAKLQFALAKTDPWQVSELGDGSRTCVHCGYVLSYRIYTQGNTYKKHLDNCIWHTALIATADTIEDYKEGEP